MEEWRSVVGYEGLYEVSSHGNIRSLDRRVAGKAGQRRKILGRSIKPALSKYGYMIVSLCKNGKALNRRVHALVAEAFIGPRPAGMLIDHIDGAKTNNVVSNLRYLTPLENTQHLTGKARSASGVRGVYKEGRFWRARWQLAGQDHNLGNYPSIEEAQTAIENYRMAHGFGRALRMEKAA